MTAGQGPSAADAWGIQQDWLDAYDQSHRVPDDTVEVLRRVVGTPPPDLEDRAPVVTRPGRDPGLGTLEIECEDGTRRTVTGRLPEDFPLGYHRLRTAGGAVRRLIVSPGRCWLPDHQQWGWAVQLYAARSRSSWGIGDLADLRTLREWTDSVGGGFLLVNPLHAVAPTLPQEASPYLPATRRFRNPVYLRVDEVPGWAPTRSPGAGDEERERLNASPLIERDGVWALKRAALWTAFTSSAAAEDGDFRSWRAEQGRSLEEFATWCALTEEHGPDWREWPAPLRRPESPEVAAFASAHPDRVTFHAWLQWLLDVQLRAATGDTTVIQDLPIGVAGGGADAWAWQDEVAAGITVGAPPDLLNTTGQDWGSPPLVPWRLRAADYEPFIQSVRGTIAGAGGLRIDHVMGLFRLWWIPDGRPATEGAYVRYPSEDLLDIVALESHRARAVVVGEDLGTVEPGVREALAERGMLSYKLLWFEDDEPAAWPAGALAAVTTHDLPTVAGLWDGSDAEDQLASTTMSEEDVRGGRAELVKRLRRGSDLAEDAPVREAVAAAYRRLAQAPSLLLSVALEDAVLEARRPNVPGTVQRENWRIPLPVRVDELAGSAEAARLAEAMTEAVSRPASSPRRARRARSGR